MASLQCSLEVGTRSRLRFRGRTRGLLRDGKRSGSGSFVVWPMRPRMPPLATILFVTLGCLGALHQQARAGTGAEATTL
jgi:hypothetical protein